MLRSTKLRSKRAYLFFLQPITICLLSARHSAKCQEYKIDEDTAPALFIHLLHLRGRKNLAMRVQQEKVGVLEAQSRPRADLSENMVIKLNPED